MWMITFYTLRNGCCPIEEFLDGLDADAYLLVESKLGLLEEYGLQLKRPLVSYLRNRIFELRVTTHKGNYRVLFFHYQSDELVLTHGFMKKERAVPPKEIQRAIAYRDDFLKQKGNVR